MKKTVAIGLQNFEELIEKDYYYIDKTDFIREWWDCGDSVTLITRPRRFGKTLNMNMVETFFSVGEICLKDFPSGRMKNIEKSREAIR